MKSMNALAGSLALGAALPLLAAGVARAQGYGQGHVPVQQPQWSQAEQPQQYPQQQQQPQQYPQQQQQPQQYPQQQQQPQYPQQQQQYPQQQAPRAQTGAKQAPDKALDETARDARQRTHTPRQVSGMVLGTKTVNVRGTDAHNLVVLIKTSQGDRRLAIDLGPQQALEQANITPGTRIAAEGYVVVLRDQQFLVATRIETGGQTLEITRPAQARLHRMQGAAGQNEGMQRPAQPQGQPMQPQPEQRRQPEPRGPQGQPQWQQQPQRAPAQPMPNGQMQMRPYGGY